MTEAWTSRSRDKQNLEKRKMAHQKSFLCFYVIFWELNLVTLPKLIQFLKINTDYIQNFIELYVKSFLII